MLSYQNFAKERSFWQMVPNLQGGENFLLSSAERKKIRKNIRVFWTLLEAMKAGVADL
jgi:hypothetical protein